MGSTERLFRAHGPLVALELGFDATLTNVRPSDASSSAGDASGVTLAVVLDRTAFYPGGGGQPCDRGTLGGAPVVAVREGEGVGVVHEVRVPARAGEAPDALRERALATFREGTRMRGEVDGARRRDLTRQHTGQHLLSAACLRALKAETAAVHFAEDPLATSSLDLGRGPLSEREVERVEDEAWRVLLEDRPVLSAVHAVEAAASLGLRRAPPRDQLLAGEGLRVVTIEGYDVSACCGTHVARTGEIGSVRILGQEKVRGQARLRFVCGERVLRHSREGDREAAAAQERAQAARRDAEKRTEGFERRLAEAIAADLAAKAREAAAAPGSPVAGPGGPLARVRGALTPDDPRADLVAARVASLGLPAVLARPGPDGLEVALARPEGTGPDLAAQARAALTPLGGKGGGRPHFARFLLPAATSVEAALGALETAARDRA